MGQRVNTQILLDQLYANRIEHSPKDLAYSVYAFLGRCFGALALAASESYDVPAIGLVGELVNQEILVKQITSFIEATGRTVYLNTQIPAGDAGLAFGQALAAARHYKIEGP